MFKAIGCALLIALALSVPEAYAQSAQGESDRAIADYDEAIKLAPRDAALFVERGILYSKQGHFDRAIQDFDEAIRADPKRATTYFHRAIAFHKRGAVERAVRDLEEALRINSKYVQAYNLRGEFLVARGEADRAIRDFDEAIRLDSRNTAAYINRGEAFAKQEQYDRAIKDYNEAIRTDAKSSKAYVGRASAYEKRGDLERARHDYDEALLIDGKDRTALKGRSIVFFKRGDFLRGFDDAKEATKLERRDLSVPTENEAALLAGGLLKERKLFSECVEVLSFAIDRNLVQDRDSFALHNARAQCYGELKQFDKREVDLKKAIELSPRQPQVVNHRDIVMAPRQAGEKRVALVIGNSSYKNGPALKNSRKDAELIENALRKASFQTVTLQTDMDWPAFIEALRTFAREASGADWAVLYYSGLGIQKNGESFLIPTDAELKDDRDLTYEAIPVDTLLAAVNGVKKLGVVVLDAARDNPFPGKCTVSCTMKPGLAEMAPHSGVLVLYPTSPGQIALEGEGDSPFVQSLARRIVTPGLEIGKLLRHLRNDVMLETGRQQEPSVYGALPPDDFYFTPPASEAFTTVPPTPQP